MLTDNLIPSPYQRSKARMANDTPIDTASSTAGKRRGMPTPAVFAYQRVIQNVELRGFGFAQAAERVGRGDNGVTTFTFPLVRQ